VARTLVKATNTVDAVCDTNTAATVCGANSHVCMLRSIHANSHMPRRDASPDTSVVLSVDIHSNIARPDANVHASSIDINAAALNTYGDVTSFKAA
jgi:hypothetical protein